MAKENILVRHSKERNALTAQRKKDWNELLDRQEGRLMESDDPKLMYRLEQERIEHNKRYNKEQDDLAERQKAEMKEFKEEKRRNRSSDELEM